jgi:hypothetical protein
MRKIHRSIEFDLHQLDSGQWEYIVYPKIERGTRFAGQVEGGESEATAAAKTEIDARLGGADTGQSGGD